MFDSTEAFFLSRGNDFAIDDQSRRTIVIEGGNTQNVHAANSENGVNERGHRRTLCEHDQSAKNEHHQQDRQQPIFFPHGNKKKKLFQK